MMGLADDTKDIWSLGCICIEPWCVFFPSVSWNLGAYYRSRRCVYNHFCWGGRGWYKQGILEWLLVNVAGVLVMLLYFGTKNIPSPNQVGVVLKMALELLLMAEIRQSPAGCLGFLNHRQYDDSTWGRMISSTSALARINFMVIFETIDFPPQVVA